MGALLERVFDAWLVRSSTSSRSVDANRGWRSETSDGGVVIRTRVLTAMRNWREDKFCGNTYERNCQPPIDDLKV